MRAWLSLLLLVPTILTAQTVSFLPQHPVSGSPILFRVKPDRALKSVEGVWLGHTVPFDFDPATEAWYGFAGIDLETTAGEQILSLHLLSETGVDSLTQSVAIGRGEYPKKQLRVPENFVKPSARELVRIGREKELKKETFAQSTAERLWSGPFVTPVEDAVSDFFGVERIFNGLRESTHTGLDFRSDTGTPVGAMNAGIVVLAGDLFYEGGFVVLDHGRGLFSMYLHLSKIAVKEGDRVFKKQVIGLSGATGRVTASCLDVRIRWQGVYVNPETLFSLPLPD